MTHLASLQAISKQLTAAEDLPALWRTALQGIAEAVAADAGSWVWETPEASVMSLQANTLSGLDRAEAGEETANATFWQGLLAQAGHPETPEVLTPGELPPEPDSERAVPLLQSVLIVPMSVAMWRGWLLLGYTNDTFTTTEVDLARYAGEITCTAARGLLRYLRVERVRARQVQELATLAQMGRFINESLDLEVVLEEIVKVVSNLLHCQRTALFDFDAVTNSLTLAAAQGVSDYYRANSQNIPVVKGGRAHAMAINKVVYSADLWEEPEAEMVAPMAKEEGFRAFADVPLHRGDQPVGLLSVQFVEPHHFSDDELNLLRILAEQAAIAIENASLYTQTDVELRRRLAAMGALQRVTREITSTIALDHILELVLQEAVRFGEASAGLVATFFEGEVQIRARHGYDAEALRHIREVTCRLEDTDTCEEDSLLRRFLDRQDTLYIPDVQLVPNSEEYPPLGHGRTAHALLVVPVFYEARISAAILLQTEMVDGFSATVKEFIEGLAAQAAIAIGNAQRYQEQLRRGELMHRRAEQMSLLLEVSRTMRSDRPLEEVLLDVAYAVQEGTGFDIVLISVLEGNSLRRVAGAGMPLVELEKRKRARLPWGRVKRLCQEQFRMGQCYYIPEGHEELFEGMDIFVPENVPDTTREWHTEDAFFVPLRGSNGEVIGIMSVDNPRDGRAPTPMTAEVIELFASQVALAIENNRLVESLRRQVTTLRLFNELNRSITTKLDLPLVLNTVVQSVTNLLGYDYATIYLQDQSGRNFVPLASSGYALDLLEHTVVRMGTGVVGSVAQMGMPLVIDDTSTDPRYEVGRVPVGSSAMVPLVVDGRSVGILAAERKAIGDFSPTEVATLTALADQVSVAVENARLFDEVKRFNEELEARVAERTQELAEALERLRLQRDRSEVLYLIASELVASLDMDRVLSQALSLLQKAVRASRSSVILLDNNTGQLFYRAAIGHTEPIPPGGKLAPFRRDQGIVGWVLEQKSSVIIPDASQDPRCTTEDAMVRSLLAVPVMGGVGEALGVIRLESPVPDVFDETQLQLVEAAAVQLGNALNNAELYRLIREQAERLGTMLRRQQIEAVKNEAILEGIADGVMVADAEGRVILFNAAAERILSISRAQAIGRFQDEILGLYGGEARAWLARIALWKEEERDGLQGSEAFLAQRLEVGRRYVSVHLSPVVTASDEFLGVVAVFRDITAEIEADRAKSDFVSTVSHELRTPMTSIVGYVDLLLSGVVGPISEMQLSFLKKVKSNADRLTGLVNDLLDISRIEQGRVELQLEPLAIDELISQVNDLLQPKVMEKEQSLQAVIPSELPLVYGDAARLTQILTNIVGNAHKYTPAGGEITIYAYVRDAKMHVAVADNGIGIAPENQKKIFERFYRVEDDPAVYEVSGTGLGLAITLSLIQMHGGTIWLESELGEGSIFTFSIPLAEGEPDHNVGELPPELVTASMATVLVVEDDAEIAELLTVTLESEGIRVLTASNGEAALRVAREKLPDLISLDIRLPDLDGFEVLQLLKRQPQTADIPVVIVSVVSDRRRGLDLGAVDYLTKPLDEERFLEILLGVLRQREMVVIANHDRELMDEMRSALQAAGLAVRTTMRGARALHWAQELQPIAMVVDLEFPDVAGYQLVESLRTDADTAGIHLFVTTTDVELQQYASLEFVTAESVHVLTKPFSPTQVAGDIANLVNGDGVGKET